jgi:putative ABC transport system substrate-binding protein
MVTGVTSISVETNAKHLELLITIAPGLRRVGFLVDSTIQRSNPAHIDAVNHACTRASITPKFAEAGRPEEIKPAITQLAKDGAQALIVLTSTWFSEARNHIVKLALAQRWPVVAGLNEYIDVGALLTYGADRLALYRRAAYYVDRILKGAKPGDLPIEQPTKFELVVDVKTAKALGLTIPQSILLQAERVIE